MVKRFSIFRFTAAPFAAQLFFGLKQNIKSLETGYKINCSKKGTNVQIIALQSPGLRNLTL